MTATAPIQMTATAPIQLKQQKVEEERDNSALELRVAAVEGGVEGGALRATRPHNSHALPPVLSLPHCALLEVVRVVAVWAGGVRDVQCG